MYLKLNLLKFSRFIYQKLHYFKNFEKSKFYNYFHYFWIILIGSNHGKRYSLYLEKKLNIIKDTGLSKKIKNKNVVIFIGDSHAEFYGRNYTTNMNNNVLFLSLWLGPALLTNFSKSAYSINRSVFFLNKVFRLLGNSNKYHIIFTFGEIDIRTAFYQLLKIFKTFKNSDELSRNIVQSFNETIFLIKKKFKSNLDINYYFKEPTPTTNKNGYIIKNNEDLKRIISSSNDLPVLGSVSERVDWHNTLVKELKLNNNNCTFLELSKDHYSNQGSINKDFSDDHHITNHKLIIEFQNSLNKYYG